MEEEYEEDYGGSNEDALEPYEQDYEEPKGGLKDD